MQDAENGEVENDSNGNHHRKTLRPWDNRKKEQSMKAKQSSYNCEICGNKYSTKYILKKHVWNVHEDRKTHQCQNCENSFKTASGLEYHIKVVHHGGKENYCAICDIEFQVCNILISRIKICLYVATFFNLPY